MLTEVPLVLAILTWSLTWNGQHRGTDGGVHCTQVTLTLAASSCHGETSLVGAIMEAKLGVST